MTESNIEQRIAALVNVYGDGQDGSCLTETQWHLLFALPADSSVTLLNLLKISELENCSAPDNAKLTGEADIRKYGQVNVSSVHAIRNKEDWTTYVVGIFPNVSNLISLFEDASYQSASDLRQIACERQKVMVYSPLTEIV